MSSPDPTSSGPTDAHQPPSDRTEVRRGANRAVYDPAEIRAILDAAPIAHVGVSTADGPIVLPMAHGRIDDTLYLHGSAANAMLRAGRGVEVCATITLVDGLVLARSVFHNSMNYRSVVVRGEARVVDDADEFEAGLRAITDHVVANWDTRRGPTDKENRATLVLALPLTEASAKVRAGAPVDDDEDVDLPHWAGVIPLTSTWGTPAADDLTPAEVTPPAEIAALQGTVLGE